jgi:hypothetical protein
MVSLKKYLKFSYWVFILFTIIFYNYKIDVYVNQSSELKRIESDILNHHNNNKWLVNFNIIQYYILISKLII